MQTLGRLLKRYMPKSLFRRALIILVLPIVLLQVVVALVFIQRHYDGVTAQMAASIASELNYAIQRVEQAPDVVEARDTLIGMSGPLGIQLGLAEGEAVRPRARRSAIDVTGSVISDTLRARVRAPISLDLVSLPKYVDARIATSKGVIRALIPRRRVNATNPHLMLVWMVVSSVLLTGIAIVFLRNQVRPIRQLAIAAAAFGRGRSPKFRPSGAEEVRRAGAAFLDMRTRIERHVETRTNMLSGVSHDLKTPLTRMKLALAVAEESDEIREIERDVDEMQRMVAGFLAFASGEGGEESLPADPAELAEEVAAEARRRGARISVFVQTDTPARPEVEMRRGAVKRALVNLVENALAFGDRIEISVRLSRLIVEITVEDDGPGIRPDQRDEALKPFVQLDTARNQNTASGTGLGLSIALDIARSHGGSLTLNEGERLGGLRAVLTLPR